MSSLRCHPTPRQLQILTHAAAGYCDKEIARIMGLSHYTVKGHIGAAIDKMGCRNRTEAAVKACRAGLL